MRDWVNFSEVKKRVKLDRVLRSYGVNWLRPSGEQQYRGRCPIHQGQGPEAFHAHLGRNVFHCFACGAGGNVLDFVAAIEGCSMREAALRLQGSQDGAGAAWASEPEQSKLVRKKRRVNPPLGFSLDLDDAHPYLAGRGMDAATASYFGVGYCGGRGLMSGRIAIPIHDADGRLVATAAAPWTAATHATDFRQAFRSRKCCSIIIGRRPPATIEWLWWRASLTACACTRRAFPAWSP
jgi:hypothetical protein